MRGEPPERPGRDLGFKRDVRDGSEVELEQPPLAEQLQPRDALTRWFPQLFREVVAFVDAGDGVSLSPPVLGDGVDT